jgi:hypothetical protein
MAFKIQDLLISDLSAEVACTKVSLFRCTILTAGPCGVISVLCTKTSVCTGHISGTTGLTVLTPTLLTCTLLLTPTLTMGGDAENPAEQLALLKAQLKEAIAEIEREEKSMEEQLKPKTREEAEDLEQKLEQALKQLKQEKSKLPRK